MEFEELLNNFVNNVEEISTNLSIEDQISITKAEALVYMVALEEYIKDSHYRVRATGEDPHLADTVMMKGTNINGIKDGSYIVGFDTLKAYIARFINDGTKFPQFTKVSHREYKHAGEVAITADHFMDKLYIDEAVRTAMMEAGALEYQKIVAKRFEQ